MKVKHKIELVVVCLIMLGNCAFLAYQLRFSRKFLYKQARTLYVRGEKDRAIDKYRTFLERFPNGHYTDKVHYDLARMLYDSGDYDRAIPRYTEFLSRFPQSERAGTARAELLEMDHILGDVESCMLELHKREYPMRAAARLREIGRPAVNHLISIVRDSKSPVRSEAVFALGWMMDSRAVETLVFVLGDESWRLRADAAFALGMIGDAIALTPLTAALSDKNCSVRVWAALALQRIQRSQQGHGDSGSQETWQSTW